MKKNLLTIMFVFSFLLIGASFVRAEVPVSSGNSVKLSKNSRAYEIKLKNLKALILKKCHARSQDCDAELANLILTNNEWERTCNQGQNPGVCWWLEWALEDSGAAYNHCVDPKNYPPLVAKNTEIIDRKKRFIKKSDSNS